MNSLKSVSQIASYLDTLEIGFNQIEITCLWEGDTINLSYLKTPVKYNLEGMRRAKMDSTYIPSPEDKLRSIQFIKGASQNCFSYALELYFKSKAIDPHYLFNEKTALKNGAIDVIVKNSFEQLSDFKVHQLSATKRKFKDDCLVLFSDKHKRTIHAAFYQKGVFYSKNGMFDPKEYSNIRTLLKSYPDTKYISSYLLAN